MSIGPFLQADINMPLRHVHKTEERKKIKIKNKIKTDIWKLHRLNQEKLKTEKVKMCLFVCFFFKREPKTIKISLKRSDKQFGSIFLLDVFVTPPPPLPPPTRPQPPNPLF